jgi:hypothetical protein
MSDPTLLIELIKQVTRIADNLEQMNTEGVIIVIAGDSNTTLN